MMFCLRKFFRGLIPLILGAAVVASAHGQGLRSAAPQGQRATTPVDGIAAVVNKDVITVKEVENQVAKIESELRAQRIAPPAREKLERQALETLITEKVIEQEAKQMGIEIRDRDIDEAIASVARRNNATVAQVQAQIRAMGLNWNEYRQSMAQQLLFDRMRIALAEQTIRVTDSEVDAFLKEQAARKASGLEPPPPPPPKPVPRPKPQPAPPLVLQLSQIFLSVPENAGPEKVTEVRKRIDDVRARLRKGESFEDLAIQFSEGPEAVRGGELGVRPASGWPELFVQNARSLQPGQISRVFQSPAGFHILKVIRRAGGQAPKPPPPPPPPEPRRAELPDGPVMVDQTKASHILIKTSPAMSDDAARQRLENARSRIVQGGESFADVARVVSEDASAPQGGELGWVNPGETVPSFEEAMNKLSPGEISEPIKSPFGWHIILVEERRTQDMADQARRNYARQMLFERRAGAHFDAWLQQMRNQAYIDNRLFRQ
ncbi:molecular chaperone SurA [Orrella marina]|uniref:Chaperone SurA n=1 Tax=Orrella marina TaxID=2163011 RepID=A0A2R4XN81_9BURK|nr:molecular chaperone SurA [Orrella marina]